MLSGSIISETFRGKNDLQRQWMLRAAVEAELGDAANELVGILLAYTPEEWDIDVGAFSNGRRSRAGNADLRNREPAQELSRSRLPCGPRRQHLRRSLNPARGERILPSRNLRPAAPNKRPNALATTDPAPAGRNAASPR